MQHLYRTQTESRQSILKIVAESGEPLTRKQITQALGRAKSPHLLEMIEELVEEGKLNRIVVTYHNGVQGYAYCVNDTP